MLESQKAAFEAKSARVVSVNLDEPPRAMAVRSYIGQQGFTFPVVLNKTAEKAYEFDKAYRVKGTPTSYLIDSEGKITDAHYGPMAPPDLKAALEKLP